MTYIKNPRRVVFITGGASGIGASIVKAFRDKGAIVAFCDIDQESGEALAFEVGAHFYQCDCSSSSQLTEVLESVYTRFGEIDIIINNVGVSFFKPLCEVLIEEFDSVINTNLRSAFITSQFLAKKRNNEEGRARYGRIINLSSTRHLQSEPNGELYGASKGGIVSLTHALAISLADYNITVNAISPGWINCGHQGDISPLDHKQHPSGRVGEVDDIARMVLFLAREENDFINGQNFVVDGGMTKKMIYLE